MRDINERSTLIVSVIEELTIFALISSRMAAWGHPPVSIARMRWKGRERAYVHDETSVLCERSSICKR